MTEIVIISGKGGTGKTSVSAAFATLNKNNVVADCDVDAANLYLILQPQNDREKQFISGYKAEINYDTCINCDLCLDYCRFDAISKQNNKVVISETSCDGCKLCYRICPVKSIRMVPSDKSRWYTGNYRNGKMVHARLSPGEENSGKLVNVVREQARRLASEMGWENIIIDGPPGTGCAVISSITGVDKVVVVTEPTRSGFHDLQRVIELVSNFKLRLYVVINKYDLNPEMSNQMSSWCSQNNIQLVGNIPFDRDVVEAMLNCQSIMEWKPGSDASREIERIWQTINSKVSC